MFSDFKSITHPIERRIEALEVPSEFKSKSQVPEQRKRLGKQLSSQTSQLEDIWNRMESIAENYELSSDDGLERDRA